MAFIALQAAALRCGWWCNCDGHELGDTLAAVLRTGPGRFFVRSVGLPHHDAPAVDSPNVLSIRVRCLPMPVTAGRELGPSPCSFPGLLF